MKINKAYSYGYLLTLALGPLQFGFAMNIFGAYSKLFMQIRKINDTSGNYSALITTMIPLGALFSSFAFCQLTTVSKRTGLILSDLLAATGVAIALFMSDPLSSDDISVATFCLGRFFLGMSLGIYTSVTPTYLIEISPKGYENLFGNCYPLFINVGIIASSLIGMAMPNISAPLDTKLEAIYIATTILALAPLLQLLLLLLVYKDETPTHYVRRGSEKQAKEALRKTYSDEKVVRQEYNKLLGSETDTPGNPIYAKNFFATYRTAVIVSIGLIVIQQLTGINVIMLYANSIFGAEDEFSRTFTILTSTVSFAAAIFSLPITEKFGRKFLLLFGCLACASAFLGCYNFYPSLHQSADKAPFTLCVLAFLVVYGVSHGPIPWLYLAEVLPESWMSVGSVVSYLFTIAVSFSTPIIKRMYGQAIFLLYATFMVLSALFIFLFMKESKGKRREEILMEYYKDSKTD